MPVRAGFGERQAAAGVVLLPAAQSRTKEAVNPDQMKKLLGALTQKYEYILLTAQRELKWASKTRSLLQKKP
jgi:septum site-determining protein MinD